MEARVAVTCAREATTRRQGDVAVVEGLRLGHVQPGKYFFVCLPLNMIGTEAAPARAILMKKE